MPFSHRPENKEGPSGTQTARAPIRKSGPFSRFLDSIRSTLLPPAKSATTSPKKGVPPVPGSTPKERYNRGTPTTPPPVEPSVDFRTFFNNIEDDKGTKGIRFTWQIARILLNLKTVAPADLFLNGLPIDQWTMEKIPTLGASSMGCRVQEMYRGVVPGGGRHQEFGVFIKTVPIGPWEKQMEAQEKYRGEFVTDGENFVMEAAALSFLGEYAPTIAPRLLAVTRLTGTMKFRLFGGEAPSNGESVSHVALVSELYGEDLLDFVERREQQHRRLEPTEKKSIQWNCAHLMWKLHVVGLAHLDYTPENILLGPRGLRICDFAKATPIWSPRIRHKDVSLRESFLFESCEPTIGKGAYMPPECWNLFWKLERYRIQYPMEQLMLLSSPLHRDEYYFRVDKADIYMIGVLMFWIWAEGGVWTYSDVTQDQRYYNLLREGLNFDLFRECRDWTIDLKELLQQCLHPDPLSRYTGLQVLQHAWFDGGRLQDCLEPAEHRRWKECSITLQNQIQHENPYGAPKHEFINQLREMEI